MAAVLGSSLEAKTLDNQFGLMGFLCKNNLCFGFEFRDCYPKRRPESRRISNFGKK